MEARAGFPRCAFFILLLPACASAGDPAEPNEELGQLEATITPVGVEVSVPRHLADGEEYQVGTAALVKHGERIVAAAWTEQEGGGRPLTKGVGAPLADQASPLVFPRNMNRLSAPDANSCFGCHAQPFGIVGGGGDFVANVFVLAHRFDFATFDHEDAIATRGSLMEDGRHALLDNIANSRATLGMFGAGYIEMLARQMTTELQAVRDAIPPGGSAALVAKGVSFGELRHNADGTWDASGVVGLPAPSVATSGTTGPNLIVRPFHQAGAVISLRQFTNNALNHHHGVQTTERFGTGTDPDGDGFVNEATRADVTAASVFQAAMAVPGRMIPDDPAIEAAVLVGEQRFDEIGCTSCHVAALPLTNEGWKFTEPNPFNPPGNLRPGEAPTLTVDLRSNKLPPPRLPVDGGVVWVPAYTDLKLHDICAGPDDPNAEPVDMHAPAGSPEFFAGNRRFLTKKLWGAANEPPYFHHGKFATMREAIVNHAGEAQAVTDAYNALPAAEQDAVIEFLKTLQVLPPGTKHLVVNEKYQAKQWPVAR